MPQEKQSSPGQSARRNAPSFPLFRIKCALAGLSLLGAVACLWTAMEMPSPFKGPGVASAETPFSAAAQSSTTQERVELQKMLLQTTVDSAALGMAGAFDKLPDEQARRAALAGALDALTFELGAPVYFTAWERTRLLHSPLTPDTEDMDFADALDSRGVAFVRALADCLENGGGFVQAVLPRQNFDSWPAPGAYAAGGSVAAGSTVTELGGIALAEPPLYTPSARSGVRHVEETQIIYTRPIPNSSWHISAFMTVPGAYATSGPSCLSATGGASDEPICVWESTILEDKDAKNRADSSLRRGLYISGLSLIGMAGALVLPRRRGE